MGAPLVLERETLTIEEVEDRPEERGVTAQSPGHDADIGDPVHRLLGVALLDGLPPERARTRHRSRQDDEGRIEAVGEGAKALADCPPRFGEAGVRESVPRIGERLKLPAIRRCGVTRATSGLVPGGDARTGAECLDMTLATAGAGHPRSEVMMDVAKVTGEEVIAEGGLAADDERPADPRADREHEHRLLAAPRAETCFAKPVGVDIVEDLDGAHTARLTQDARKLGTAPARHRVCRRHDPPRLGIYDPRTGDGDPLDIGAGAEDAGRFSSDPSGHCGPALVRKGRDLPALLDGQVLRVNDRPCDLRAADVEGEEGTHEFRPTSRRTVSTHA